MPEEGERGIKQDQERTVSPKQKASTEAEGAEYPPLLDYLQTKEGHEVVSRILSIVEDIKKATIERSAEQHRQDAEFHHRTVRFWLALQGVIFAATLLVAAVLAWHDKRNATVAAFMGTLLGYFLGRRSE